LAWSDDTWCGDIPREKRSEAYHRKAEIYETMTTDAEGRVWTFEARGRKPPVQPRVRAFALCAARAVVEAGFVEAGAREDVQVVAWLAQLKARRLGACPGDPDEITSVIAASTLLCAELATAAYMASRQEAVSPSPESLAVWLEKALRDKGWTPQQLEKKHGPTSKTTRRILAGAPVIAATLEKLAAAFRVPAS
jgi:hypothetical protein